MLFRHPLKELLRLEPRGLPDFTTLQQAFTQLHRDYTCFTKNLGAVPIMSSCFSFEMVPAPFMLLWFERRSCSCHGSWFERRSCFYESSDHDMGPAVLEK